MLQDLLGNFIPFLKKPSCSGCWYHRYCGLCGSVGCLLYRAW
ncbi:hypothetical protein ACNKHV_27390 [Shigella flexneri]